MPSDVDEIFDEDEERESFSKLFLPFVLLGFQKGVSLGLKQGQGVKADDIFTETIKAALKDKSFQHAAMAVNTTKDQLQGLIGKAIEEGQGIPELAKAINQQFSLDSKVRSLRIARTELTDTINDGTLRTLVLEGYQEKQWSTVIDGRERETHAAANGQTVGIYDSFRVGGNPCQAPGQDSLPASERINCRCTIVGAGVPVDRAQKLGEMFLRTHGSLERQFVIMLRREFERQRRRVLSHFPT